MNRKNTKVLIFEMIVIVLAIVGVTLAVSYLMNNISVSTSNANLAVDYTGAATLPTVSLAPVADSAVSSNTNNVLRINFSVKGTNANPNKDIIYDVILDELDISCYLKQEYVKWQLYKNSSLLTSGNFSPTFDIMEDNKLYLTTIQQDLPKYNETADSYELVIWVSESCTESSVTSCTSAQDQGSVMGQTISGKVKIALYTDSKKVLTRTTGDALVCDSINDNSGANPPALVDGLIPVKYDEENSTWVKADSTNKRATWYNYSTKRWANAVLVSYTNRSTYVSANEGTPIPESDVLAYYVWIPRYKYKVFNITKTLGTDSYNARTTGIDIVFAGGKQSTGTIKCTYDFTVTNGSLSETCTGSNGDYYTHPAFTFGDTELTGIWVGKFEISSENPSASYGGDNVTNLTVRIKPNVTSWRKNTVSNYWKVIYDMQQENNIYGLNTSRKNTDSHMLKNMEWGAIAYLTNSKYGRCTNNVCTEVTTSTSYTSGLGAGTSSTYNTASAQLLSTTGNIYGIYDLAGGAWEWTMGNSSSAAGTYSFNQYNAGTNYTYQGYEKYVDTYAYGTTNNDQTSYNRARLGDATGETMAWNRDNAKMPSSTYPWCDRGGRHDSAYIAGMFASSGWYGNANSDMTARAALVSLK